MLQASSAPSHSRPAQEFLTRPMTSSIPHSSPPAYRIGHALSSPPDLSRPHSSVSRRSTHAPTMTVPSRSPYSPQSSYATQSSHPTHQPPPPHCYDSMAMSHSMPSVQPSSPPPQDPIAQHGPLTMQFSGDPPLLSSASGAQRVSSTPWMLSPQPSLSWPASLPPVGFGDHTRRDSGPDTYLSEQDSSAYAMIDHMANPPY